MNEQLTRQHTSPRYAKSHTPGGSPRSSMRALKVDPPHPPATSRPCVWPGRCLYVLGAPFLLSAAVLGALADASVRFSKARQASYFPLLTSHTQGGSLTSHHIQRGVPTSLIEGRLVDHAQNVDQLSGHATSEMCYEPSLLPPLPSKPSQLN